MTRDDRLLRFLGYSVVGDLGPYTFYTSKRHGIVWFTKSPPKEPPSILQVRQRNLFRLVGYAWRSLAPTQRTAWETAAIRTGAACTGYNLFTAALLRPDPAWILTLERQSHLQLYPLLQVA
jgi:hypothetical protein